MLQLDVLIFDMDGVLIDVSASYRDAVRQSAQLYLEAVMGLPPCADDLISREEVAAFKLAGGFNNDWDLATGVLQYFVAMLDAPPATRPPPETLPEISALLRQAGRQISATVETLRQRKDMLSFADTLRTRGSGLEAVRNLLGNRNDHLLFAKGDLRRTNLVKRLFEEIYLGEDLFREEYGESSIFHHGAGLIHHERLIPNPQTLIALSQRVALGIATGRPRRQAIYALERTGILKQFRALVTLEDILAAEISRSARNGRGVSLSKPHPFALWEAVTRITPARVRGAYVGDTPDDVRAANAAKREMDFVSIGCLAAAEDQAALRRELERVGVDVIVEHPDELVELIEQ
jgi:HAD superfamily hydrolase (TIGR01548 family)